MKAKVIIENGRTTIVLTPENEFDTDVIEKVHSKKEKYSILTTVDAKITYPYGRLSDHKIKLSIDEI